jgi:hypothetical protein
VPLTTQIGVTMSILRFLHLDGWRGLRGRRAVGQPFYEAMAVGLGCDSYRRIHPPR